MTLLRFIAALMVVAALSYLAACTSTSRSTQHAAGGPGSGKGLYKVGNPYQVEGIWYYPHDDWNYDETGIASWYGQQFHGKFTANGEVFDLGGLTAAHHTLPLPSIVEVTNLENGRTVTLRVNDRGPFARGRVIDLSQHAAQLLGYDRQGTAKVRVRLLVTESMQAQAVARRNGIEEVPGPAIEVAQAAPRTVVDAQPLAALPGSRAASAQPPGGQPVKVATATADDSAAPVDPPLTGRITLDAPKPNAQIFVQAGAFAQAENARRVKQRVDAVGATNITAVRINGANLYRVRVGPLGTVEAADQILAKVLASGYADAKIVVE